MNIGLKVGMGRNMMPGYGGMFRSPGGMFGGGAPLPGMQSGNVLNGVGNWWDRMGQGEGGTNNQAMLILGALGGLGNYFGQKGQVDVQRDRLKEERRQYEDQKVERDKERERRKREWAEWMARNIGTGG